MLQPIMKSKYPDITEEEQAISIPLQVPVPEKKQALWAVGRTVVMELGFGGSYVLAIAVGGRKVVRERGAT